VAMTRKRHIVFTFLFCDVSYERDDRTFRCKNSKTYCNVNLNLSL
jgi:hypothetical protein